jgi:Fur family transcriptional regulator, ferric uptake regulator
MLSVASEFSRTEPAPPKAALTKQPSNAYTAIMADAEAKCPKRRFIDFLTQKNLRLTSQRQAIIESVFSTQQHFTAEQLLEWSRARDKSVSRATVYRTLPLLTESGLLREMDFGKDYKFYDPNYAEHPNHNHIICQDCDKIVEFDSDKIEKIENEITHRLGFAVKSHRLQITATCEDLKKLGACKKKSRC